jgi:signal transduction histidine kinase
MVSFMHHKSFKRVFHSVFTKLLVTIVISGIAITFLVIGGYMQLRKHSLESLDQNLSLYLDYLIAELGDPPSLANAIDISHRTGAIIQYDSPGNQWKTADIPSTLNLKRARTFSRDPERIIGLYRGNHFVQIHRGDKRLLFILPWAVEDKAVIVKQLAGMGVLLAAILGAAYFYIRRVLKPIRDLKVGVETIGSGNLEHRVPLGPDNELRDLARAFNQMAERLEALLKVKEQLLLDVSHELRSPLTRLKVGLEFIPEGEDRESLSEDILGMEKMITEILEAAKVRKSAAALNLTLVKPATLVRTLLADYENRLPRVIAENLLETELMLDLDKIEMVLRNILDNALKYSSPKGDKVVISMSMEKHILKIIIRDNGIGIPEDALPFIFEPFFRVDDSRTRKTGGYGLGLSLCKAIMSAHGGEIDITSAPGKGTQVVLAFSH